MGRKGNLAIFESGNTVWVNLLAGIYVGDFFENLPLAVFILAISFISKSWALPELIIGWFYIGDLSLYRQSANINSPPTNWLIRYLRNWRGHAHQNWCEWTWHQSLLAWIFWADSDWLKFLMTYSPWVEREIWSFLKVAISPKLERSRPPKLVCMNLTLIPTCMNFLGRFWSIKFFDDHGL